MFNKFTAFLILALMLVFSGKAISQEIHNINFEPDGVGADWEWTVDDNDDDPNLEFIANPDPTGGNMSPTVAKFTARATGNPWALFFTNDNGQFTFDDNNSQIKIMVHKSRISPIGIKFEGGTGTPLELQVPNNVTGEWEELTFDFSERIGQTFSRMVIIPDFEERSEENIVYIDNIQVPMGEVIDLIEPEIAAPTPGDDPEEVISIFSDAYENLPGTEFNPVWGQSTQVSQIMIEENNTLLYETLNFQGTQLAANQDLSDMNFLHIDFWTQNATMLSVSLVKLADASPKEAKYDFSITNNEWVSVDIPLSHFEALGLVLDDIHQLKVDGNGSVYFDNIYFKVGEPVVGNPTHTIDFEPEGVGANWDWTVNENDDNPDLEFIENPNPSGGNTSPTVAKFTARAEGNPWALFFTSDDGEFTFDAENSMVKMMVHKSRATDVGMKFEGASGASPELKVSNTVVGEWEELTFDFSSEIGKSYSRIVIIPDFLERSEEQIVYIDNLVIPDGVVVIGDEPKTAAPNPPALGTGDVISIFSNAYENLEGTNFNPSWGQSTSVSEVLIEENNTLKYEFLNYQGTELAAAQDVSEMNYLHLDFWTANSTELSIALVKQADASPKEAKYDLTIINNEWVSIDISLEEFTSLGLEIDDIHQLKIEGNGTVFFDNIYFRKDVNSVRYTTNNNSIFTLESNYPNPFSESTQIRFNLKESNQVTIELYDSFGQKVKVLMDEFKASGNYNLLFESVSLSSGNYILVMKAGNLESARTIIIAK
ncbi:T9SS type A sorting domain-containing protein [Candidatus Kapabacteria bacterium]|nr:T9SS type A sorting domain-containing protein [Candidatus Kapabacteria bacterium]